MAPSSSVHLEVVADEDDASARDIFHTIRFQMARSGLPNSRVLPPSYFFSSSPSSSMLPFSSSSTVSLPYGLPPDMLAALQG